MLEIALILYSVLFTLLLTPAVIYFSKEIKLVYFPDKMRIYKKTVPFTAGILILFSIILCFFLLKKDVLVKNLVIFSFLFFILGFLSDTFEIKFKTKVILQVIILSFFLFQKDIQNFWVIFFKIKYLDFSINLIWMLIIINAFNLIDGIDGLAIILSIIAFSCFIIIEAPKDKNLYYMLFIITGSLIGLLKYNLPEAKIFLGDNGSLTLGFLLSALSVLVNSKTLVTYSIFLPITVILIPVVDFFIVSFKREKKYIYHELLNLGFSKKQIIIFLSIITSILSLIALYNFNLPFFIFCLFLVILIDCFIIYVRISNRAKLISKIKRINRKLRVAIYYISKIKRENNIFKIFTIFFILIVNVAILLKIKWNLVLLTQFYLFFIIFIIHNFFDFKDATTKMFSNFIIFWYYLFLSFNFYSCFQNYFNLLLIFMLILNIIKILIEKRFELFLYNPVEITIIHFVIILILNNIINFKIFLLSLLFYYLYKNFMDKNIKETKLFHPLFLSTSLIIPSIKILGLQ